MAFLAPPPRPRPSLTIAVFRMFGGLVWLTAGILVVIGGYTVPGVLTAVGGLILVARGVRELNRWTDDPSPPDG